MVHTTASLANGISQATGKEVPTWRVRRVFEMDCLSVVPARAGVARIITDGIASAVIDALHAGGYLTKGEADTAKKHMALPVKHGIEVKARMNKRIANEKPLKPKYADRVMRDLGPRDY